MQLVPVVIFLAVIITSGFAVVPSIVVSCKTRNKVLLGKRAEDLFFEKTGYLVAFDLNWFYSSTIRPTGRTFLHERTSCLALSPVALVSQD
jgi:hypothetical protein